MRALIPFVALCACGPEIVHVEPADCEGNGPTRLVDVHGTPSAWPSAIGIRDERGWLFFDGTEGIEGRNLAVECGSRPRVFARDIPLVFRYDGGGPWLGVAQPPGEGADLFVLDPWGGTPPIAISRRVLGLSDGTLYIGDDKLFDGELLLWRVADIDPFTLEAVPLDLRRVGDQRASWGGEGQDVEYDPLELVFAKVSGDETDATIGFDPQTGEAVFFEAKEFAYSKMGGRFVILREGGGDAPERHTVVDAREPGRRVEAADGWEWKPVIQRSDQVAFIRMSGDEVTETMIVLLPELRSLRLEGDWSLGRVHGTMTDDRHILTNADHVFLVGRDDTEPRPLLEAVEGWGEILDDALYIWDSRPDGSAMIHAPLDGSPPSVILEPPVLSALRLTRDRWALQRYESGGKADLHVLDRITGREEIVLEGIDRAFDAWNGPHASRVVESEPSNEIVYSTTSSDGTTLWRFVP